MAGFFSKGGRSSGRLGRRLIINILLANALLSVFAASFQLYASYKQGWAEVAGKVQIIDDSFRYGFEEALWKYDFQLIDALLEGIVYDQAVRHVILETDNGRRWELGNTQGVAPEVSGSIEFQRQGANGETLQLGRMYVGLGLASVRSRMWAQFWALVQANFAKTFAASVVMVLLFDRMVTRHLQDIAAYVSAQGWFGNQQALCLDRSSSQKGDDIDQIVNAINAAHEKGRQDYEALEREVQRRRVVETMLRQRTQALQDANKEQSQFTYAISHDMKSPVNSIHMLIDELSRTEAGNLSPDGQDILSDVHETAKRMMNLIEDVLLYSRTVNDAMDVDDVDLNAVVQKAREGLCDVIETQGASVDIGQLPDLRGNAHQLQLLFHNLIGNGLKFRANDSVPHVSVASVPSHRPGFVTIRIADSGIGIPAEHHDKVFALFQRLHTHASYPGSGVGLTISKRVVANHGGQISLQSSQGSGCIIDVELPQGGP